MNIECDGETLAELEHAFKFNDAVRATSRSDAPRRDDAFADDEEEKPSR